MISAGVEDLSYSSFGSLLYLRIRGEHHMMYRVIMRSSQACHQLLKLTVLSVGFAGDGWAIRLGPCGAVWDSGVVRGPCANYSAQEFKKKTQESILLTCWSSRVRVDGRYIRSEDGEVVWLIASIVASNHPLTTIGLRV